MDESRVARTDLERLIERSEGLVAGVGVSRTQQQRLANHVERMDLLMSSLEKTLSVADLVRFQRAVDRFHALLSATGPSSHGSVSLSGVPAAIKMAVGGGELSTEQKTAHVGATARALAGRHEQALAELLDVEPAVEQVRWETFASAKASVAEMDDKTQTERLLAFHADEQERLTDEMVAGSAVMRDMAMAISDTLRGDKERLAELDKISASNSAVLARERDRIKQQVGRTCGFTLMVIVVCVVVLMVFIWMVLLIRFSRK